MGSLNSFLDGFAIGLWVATVVAYLAFHWRAKHMSNQAALEQAVADIMAATGTLTTFVGTVSDTFAAIGKSVADASAQLTALLVELTNGVNQGWPGLSDSVA